MLELIFGLIILGIVVFIAFRVLNNITVGILLIFLVFLSSYLIMGSFPNLKDVPVIGKYLKNLQRTTGEAIAIAKDNLYNIEIFSVARDSENNLLITVANTGKKEVNGFNVFVDEKQVSIINNPEDPLKSGQITVIQVDWKETFRKVLVQTDKASDSFESS